MASEKLTCISTDAAPAAIGPYSQAVVSNGMVYVSGMIGLAPGASELVSDDVIQQAAQALANLAAVLEAAASDMSHVVKCTVLLRDMSVYKAVNEVYAKAFGEHKPARAAYAVVGLPMDAQIEIEAIATVV